MKFFAAFPASRETKLKAPSVTCAIAGEARDDESEDMLSICFPLPLASPGVHAAIASRRLTPITSHSARIPSTRP